MKTINSIKYFTRIDEERILTYINRNNFTNIFDNPLSLAQNSKEFEKVNTLRNIIKDFNIISGLAKDYENNSEHERVKNYFFYALNSKKNREVLALAIFNKEGKILKITKLTEGTINSALIPKSEILQEIQQHEGKQILLCHNHPSGDSTPSKEDIGVTKNINAILKARGVHLIDHVVIGSKEISSMKKYIYENETITHCINPSEKFQQICLIHVNRFINNISQLTDIPVETFNNKIFNTTSTKEILDTTVKVIDYYDLLKYNRPLNELKEIINKYSYSKMQADNKILINSPVNAVKAVNELVSNRKGLVTLYLDNKNFITSFELYADKINTRQLVDNAIFNNSNHIILVSKFDKDVPIQQCNKITQGLVNILKPMGIEILDYIKITDSKYISLKEENLLIENVKNDPCYKNIPLDDHMNNTSEMDWQLEA